ncbi:ADP-ribosylglycohydrolase family protein [Lacticaseibacillus brantae]|uniref:ADP-ribosylglycohydrolase n=1 Tax=Lacticaseibacillus brantae DSM 23927 TaxID=1423727 RepID=A0A0R2AY58_9LACO|nr:ADP-ribosylglycohydrolase family protein [Lacticaseibacillus brantae]KRM71442.1 ADP-ribosylglycohydrolase [Lacticaseibacillus brantae DSM 23927]
MLSQQQIKHLITGSMVADALGVPVEFQPRQSVAVSGMTGYGTYNQPPGTWSDDSSLTLILMANLTEGGDLEDLFRKMVRYVENGDYTPFGQMFDIGVTTQKAIDNFRARVAPLDCGDPSEFANGNGAIMRLAPLAITLLDQVDLVARIAAIHDYTVITHAHPRSVVASVIYCELLRELFLGQSLASALAIAMNRAEEVNQTDELMHFSRLRDGSFVALPESVIASDGYVVHSLEAALWANFQAETFETVVLKAVNLGNDADTVAQLAAIIFLSGHPEAPIPSDWLKTLVTTPQADQITADFAQAFGQPN